MRVSIRKHQITYQHLVPPLWHMILTPLPLFGTVENLIVKECVRTGVCFKPYYPFQHQYPLLVLK